MSKFAKLFAGLAALTLATGAFAAPVFEITEVYIGLKGEDGTPDWIEVTNTGDMAGSTLGLYYDDESLDAGEAGNLPDVTLQPGASMILLTGVDFGEEANDISNFHAIWGTSSGVYATNGGGGLSQDGDTAGLVLADNTVVDAVTYPGVDDFNTSTFDVTSGSPVLSQVGVNGAYESNPFFNDNIGGPENEVTLIGSPLLIPEPATLTLLAIVGLAAIRRR